MACLLCQRDLHGASAVSLLGYSICPDCEQLIVSTSPGQLRYEALVRALGTVWTELRGDRSWDELISEDKAGG